MKNTIIYTVLGFFSSLILSAIAFFFSGVWVPHGNGGVSTPIAYTLLGIAILLPILGIIWGIWFGKRKNTQNL